eukprot:4110177-Pleurochrysis_carterae.AAC.2
MPRAQLADEPAALGLRPLPATTSPSISLDRQHISRYYTARPGAGVIIKSTKCPSVIVLDKIAICAALRAALLLEYPLGITTTNYVSVTFCAL